MKLNETKIFVFIASIIVGILVAMNLSFGPLRQTQVLSSKQYMEAINERTKLYSDIGTLQNQYSENFKKLDKYNVYNAETTDKIVESMSKELEMNKSLLGTEEVQGKGVEIILNDATTAFEGSIQEDEYLQWARIVHNTDIMELVNGLRIAGAQAISINGQRIMSTSEFYCWGPFLKINGVNISAPFNISAIGDSETIKQFLYSDNGYLIFLKYRNIYIDFKMEEKVKIPGYIGDYDFKFAKEVKNN